MVPFTVARADTSIGPPLGPSVIAHETIINVHASVGRVGLVLDCDLERRINVLKWQLACRALTSRYPLVRVLSYPCDFRNFFGGWDDSLGGSRIRQKGDDDQQLLCTSVHRSEQPFIAQPGIFAKTASFGVGGKCFLPFNSDEPRNDLSSQRQPEQRHTSLFLGPVHSHQPSEKIPGGSPLRLMSVPVQWNDRVEFKDRLSGRDHAPDQGHP